ncbi:MAG: 4Fe-4S dicluster domain-containing protein [Smithella sp.]
MASFLSSTLLPFQFIPALIRTFTNPSAIFVVGFIALILITLIFGRVYCSFLCPLGTLQDIFIALSRKIGWRKIHSFQKPRNLLRYSLLAIIVITAAMGSMSLLNLFDPFSITGRIITQFIQPLFFHLHNFTIGLIKYFDLYLFSRDSTPLILPALVVNIALVILIVAMSLRYGRLYCNTLCPVGALLGLIAHVSLFKFAIDKTNCIECLKCVDVCKAGCVDAQNAKIDQSRCIGCFNCLSICPQSIVSYHASIKKTASASWSPARRSVLIGSIAAAGSAFLMFNSGIRSLLRPAQAAAASPITPPGSLSLGHFTQSCSACHLCVSACPTKVITPSLLEYGISGLLQPKMNYPNGFCEYECNLCGQICPTGAILPLRPDEKQITQIGEVDLLKDKCVVYLKHENCGACVEVCPTHTITFIEKNNILYPEVDNRYCIGCGACSQACPTAPKSIIVRSNPVHKKAEKYTALKPSQPQEKTTQDEFPF